MSVVNKKETINKDSFGFDLNDNHLKKENDKLKLENEKLRKEILLRDEKLKVYQKKESINEEVKEIDNENKKHRKRIGKRNMWTKIETKSVILGYNKMKNIKPKYIWKAIKENYFDELKNRNTVQIKDKIRNLINSGVIEKWY